LTLIVHEAKKRGRSSGGSEGLEKRIHDVIYQVPIHTYIDLFSDDGEKGGI
jgi:hypothetical protein